MKHKLKKSLRRLGRWPLRILVAGFFALFVHTCRTVPVLSGWHLVGAFAYGGFFFSEVLGSIHDFAMKRAITALNLYEQVGTLTELYLNKQAELDRALGFATSDEAPDTQRNPTTIQ